MTANHDSCSYFEFKLFDEVIYEFQHTYLDLKLQT